MSKWDVARALKAADLPAPAKLIMWDLLDSADAVTAEIPEQFTPSLTELTRTTGLGRSTVARELNRLEHGGWVTRSRPDPVKARTEFARTGYRLAVPPSPTVGPGLEPSPAPGPDLVPERDEPRPTAGHIPIPHHPDPDQSPSDDRKRDGERELLEAIIDEVRQVTGTTIPLGWAPRVRDCILETTGGDEREDIHDPVAYARKAIRAEPDPRGRFLPSIHATPAAADEDLPPWCGSCGDLGARSNPAEGNPRFRYLYDDEGRPGPMCTCHPDHPNRKDPTA